MKFRFSLFYIGILLIILGSVVAGIILFEASKNSNNFRLDNFDVVTLPMRVEGKGIGFYLISSESYQNNILARL